MDFVSVVFLVHSRHTFHDKVLLVVYIQVFGFLIDVPLYRGTTPIISSGTIMGGGRVMLPTWTRGRDSDEDTCVILFWDRVSDTAVNLGYIMFNGGTGKREIKR